MDNHYNPKKNYHLSHQIKKRNKKHNNNKKQTTTNTLKQGFYYCEIKRFLHHFHHHFVLHQDLHHSLPFHLHLRCQLIDCCNHISNCCNQFFAIT